MSIRASLLVVFLAFSASLLGGSIAHLLAADPAALFNVLVVSAFGSLASAFLLVRNALERYKKLQGLK